MGYVKRRPDRRQLFGGSCAVQLMISASGPALFDAWNVVVDVRSFEPIHFDWVYNPFEMV